jgi:hypothetical protein
VTNQQECTICRKRGVCAALVIAAAQASYTQANVTYVSKMTVYVVPAAA